MGRVKAVLQLIEDLSPNVPSSGGALGSNDPNSPMQKQLRKDGTRVTKQGSTTTITNTKTGKKITMRDTGRNVMVRAQSKGQPPGKDIQTRGTADDLQASLDWVKNK